MRSVCSSYYRFFMHVFGFLLCSLTENRRCMEAPPTRASDGEGPEAGLTDRAKTVMDMFDLAGAPVKSVVARLVKVDGGEPIEIAEGDTVVKIGRSKDLPISCRLDNPRLSSMHCELHLSPATLVVELVDTSTNGTFVNGARVEKGTKVVLQSGDTISLVNPATQVDADERKKLELLFQRLKASSRVEQMVQELTCGICCQLFYRACTVLPCLHCFCGHCVSQWMKSSSQCPECRGDIYEIRPTHKINNVVEQLLLKKPELRRAAEDIAECEKLNDIPPTGKLIKKRPRDDDEWSSSSESSDDDDDDGGAAPGWVGAPAPYAFHFTGGYFGAAGLPPTSCAQCTTPAADGYICPPGAIHIRCFSCKTPFPERPLCNIPQRCEMCRTPFCDLYLGGCKNPGGVGYLQPIKDHAIDALPARLFNGNSIEQSILSSYLAASGATVQAAWAECLRKFGDGTWTPDLPGCPGTPTAHVCKPCVLRVFSALAYHYRRAISRDALPASVTNRPNCWYGRECRTQFKNIVHAQNYNHVCPQEKRKE